MKKIVDAYIRMCPEQLNGNTQIRVNYYFEKDNKVFVNFNCNGRNYSRECEYYFGMYHFSFKGKLWSRNAQRIIY